MEINVDVRPQEIVTYSCSTSHRNPITWKQFRLYATEALMANPTKDMLWYPNFTCQSNYFSHECIALFLHYIPAYILDFIALILGKPQRLVKTSSIMIPFQFSIHEKFLVFGFLLHRFDFTTKLIKQLTG